MNICLFASEDVGMETLKIFLNENIKLSFLVIDSNGNKEINNKMIKMSKLNKDKVLFSDCINDNISILNSANIDLSILAWWRYIIKEPLINIAKIGFLNFHPSFLPYNRGKHYFVWNIIENVPFGVTIHFIDKNIDSGDIVFQKRLKTTMEDNGFSLREKAKIAIVELFHKHFHDIVNARFFRKKQNLSKGSFHLSKELEDISIIDLQSKYYGYELLNLIRANSGFKESGCYFFHDKKKFRVTIDIQEVRNQ